MSALDWTAYQIGDHRISCPNCGRGGRDRTLGVTVEAVSGVAHCHRCHYVETWRDRATARRPGKACARPVAQRKHERLSEYGRDLWDACTGPADTVGATYLAARVCAIPPVDGDLRFHPNLEHPSGYIGPALVALITDAISGEPISLHRTWIRADGTKAAVDPPRLLLGNHRKQGGVIRLWPDDCVTYGLAVAEGVETALSLAHAYTPVWSLIDAGNLAALPVLPGIETLLIGADNDQAGIKAANDCAARWMDAGVEVRLTQQSENDINDALLEAA